MPKYVAFLRAINVGGHVVKMDQLRDLFDELGFTNVETFIASGNVIFDSSSRVAKALERKIEKHLRERLGYEVATFIRSITEVAEMAGYEPFADADGHIVYLALVSEQPSDEMATKLMSFMSMAAQSTGCVARSSASQSFLVRDSRRRWG
jgi:uncharacterized protein (DUF1697 family)